MKPETKKSNPKDIIGSTKLPLSLLSGIAKIEWCLAQLEGALKYGTWNWRDAGVRTSIYLDALERHLEKFKNGEDRDPVTRAHHLGSIMACAAIILDADSVGKLTDDRPPRAPAAQLIDDAQKRVIHLLTLYGDEKPRNFTIEDSQWAPESQPKPTTTSTTARRKRRSSGRRVIKPAPKPSRKAQLKRETIRKSITSVRSRREGRTPSRTGE